MWGTCSKGSNSFYEIRLPAYAGSTCLTKRASTAPKDHPRMCGEHCFDISVIATSSGSSPHVRGALLDLASNGFLGGIIPVCAGSTVSASTLKYPIKDHPRMCGEHVISVTFLLFSKGSSPHVRGAHYWFYRRSIETRIIPACAGSTICFRK